MLYTNSNGLFNKVDELKQAIALYKPSIICVTETHLDKHILDAEISIPGYIIFRQDRNFRIKDFASDTSRGGGSIVYIHHSFRPTRIEDFSTIDSLAVKLETNIGIVNVVCVYRSISLNNAQNNSLTSSIQALLSVDETETVIVGDFNMPDVCWITGTLNAPRSTSNRSLLIQDTWLKLVENNGLAWLLTDEITRRRLFGGSIQESTLDQVFSTNDAMFSEFDVVSPLGKSDHMCVNLELNFHCPKVVDKAKSKPKPKKRAWSKINSNELLDLSLEQNWSFSSDGLSADEMWAELLGKLEIISSNVPLSRVKQMPWAKGPLKRARKAKDSAWSLFDSDPTVANLNIALGKQGLFEKVNLKSKIQYEKVITSNLKQNCKPFYAYLRSKRVLNSNVSSLSKPDGSLTKDHLETAEALADAFESVFVKEPEGPLDRKCYTSFVGNAIEDLVIDFEDVRCLLAKLDISKAQGPDSVHPKILKSLSENINFVKAMWELFNKCSESCSIPEQWKTANVTSLFKKGSKKDPLNYRPVSLTCILSKVYEKIVRRHIFHHVERQISPEQHGFVEQKSCLSNLLESVELIIDMLEEGAPVDILYFDFRKAFDSVPHYRLLTKLESFGITGKTLDIIRDFLSGRSFRTFVVGELSSARIVLSGVPQGMVLGPLLFVIFINDLPDNIKAMTRLFADDLKAFVDANNCSHVENMLEDLQNWEDTWLLSFNPGKCKVLHLQFNSNPMNQYIFNGVALDAVETERDLGVVTNKSMSWDTQINACISKANQMIAWVTRNTVLRDIYVMRSIYKTVIRPHLEYCVQLWSPTASHGNWTNIIKIENVQRRFTRLIDGIGTLPYSERLEALKLTTLAERRIRGDLIETFKIINGLVNYGQNLFSTGRSGAKLISKKSSSADRKVRQLKNSFLSERVIGYWNKLPSSVRNTANVEEFKISLESFKKEHLHVTDTNNFWEVSGVVISKIEGSSYEANKAKHISYLRENPRVAKRKGVNIY